MPNWTKILCAVDFSASSRRAMEVAAALAHELHAELSLVHVQPEIGGAVDLPTMPTGEPGESSEGLASSWRLDAEQLAGSATRLVLSRGDPAGEILHLAEAGNFDVIVLATQGRGGLAHALLGSVADKVARHATCSVVFARPTPWRGE